MSLSASSIKHNMHLYAEKEHSEYVTTVIDEMTTEQWGFKLMLLITDKFRRGVDVQHISVAPRVNEKWFLFFYVHNGNMSIHFIVGWI